MVRFKDIRVSEYVDASSTDGVDILNVYEGKSTLSKKMSPYPQLRRPLMLDNIPIFNLNKFMTYLNRERYGVDNFLSKKKVKNEYVRLKSRHIDDYWGIVAYLLVIKVRLDKELYQLLKTNTIPFGGYSETTRNTPLFGQELSVKVNVNKIFGYVKTCEYVQELVRNIDIYDNDKVIDELMIDFPNLRTSVNKVLSIINQDILDKQK